MAGITKEERAARAAAKAVEQVGNSVKMCIEQPEHPGLPTEADVHMDEVENWKTHGWKVKGE